MRRVVGVIVSAAIVASEFKIFGNLVTIAEVQCQLVRNLVAEAQKTLVTEAGVAVRETVGSGSVRAVGVNQIVRFRIRAQNADTETNIWLDHAFRIEVVDTIQHQFHDLQVACSLGNRADWGGAIERGRNGQIVIAVTSSAFKAETVIETVAKTKTKAERFVSVGHAAHRGVDVLLSRIVVELAIKSVGRIGTGIPPVLCMCDKAGRRECGRGCRAHKSFLHTQSPFVCRMTGLSSAAGSYG